MIRIVQRQRRLPILLDVHDAPPDVIQEMVAEIECDALGTPGAAKYVRVDTELLDDGFYETIVYLG